MDISKLNILHERLTNDIRIWMHNRKDHWFDEYIDMYTFQWHTWKKVNWKSIDEIVLGRFDIVNEVFE